MLGGMKFMILLFHTFRLKEERIVKKYKLTLSDICLLNNNLEIIFREASVLRVFKLFKVFGEVDS